MGGLIVSYIESDTHTFFIIKASIRLVNLSKVQGCISVRGGPHVGLSTAQQTTAAPRQCKTLVQKIYCI